MPLFPRTAYPIPDMWNTFGHSYLQFTGGAVDQTGRLDAIFRSSLDIEYTNWRNRAVSGAQLILQGRKLGGFGRVFQECGKNTSRGAPYTGDGGALLMCYGINDLGNNGSGVMPQLRNNFIHAMRSCISLWRASRVFDDTSPTVSYAAGFTLLAGTSEWSFGNSTRAANALTNANFTITLPADYNGETIAICFDGQSTNGGTVTFSGTAGVTGTLSVSNVNHVIFNHGKIVRRITNLTSANAGQTIVCTVTQLDSGGTVAFDAWWLEAQAPPPVIVCNVARITASGYGLYGAWTGTETQKDADVTALNNDLVSLIAEFDSMVQIADIDSAMNKDVTLFWDGLHPNELGAAKCADACLAAMRRLRPSNPKHGVAAHFNVPSPRQGAIVRPRRTGTYYTAEHRAQGTAQALVAQTQYWLPWVVCQGRERYIKMAVATVAAGTTQSTLRWGIYDDVGWTGYPQCLVTELTTAGAFSVPNTANVLAQSPASGAGSLNLTLDPGLYWLSVKMITLGTSQTFLTLAGPSTFLMPNMNQVSGVAVPGVGYSLASQGTGALADIAATGASQVDNVPMMSLQLF